MYKYIMAFIELFYLYLNVRETSRGFFLLLCLEKHAESLYEYYTEDSTRYFLNANQQISDY